ncbi:hypothetical protein [Lysinibacillus fusiformis]|uniref:hypothetical protein n=1 Tax=Lysinibacillus fusiformis TaxID=28031 RepID=UPI0030177611
MAKVTDRKLKVTDRTLKVTDRTSKVTDRAEIVTEKTLKLVDSPTPSIQQTNRARG